MKRAPLLLCTVVLLICFLCGCALFLEKGIIDSNESKITDRGSATDDSLVADGKSVTEPDNTEPDDTELETLQKKIAQSGGIVGVAFLGYVDSTLSRADLSVYLEAEAYIEKFPFLLDAACSMTEGQELYAIVPVNQKGVITVYPSAITDSGEYADDKNNPLYTGEPGEVVLLRCNLSEIYSNVLVSATDGVGAIDFHPAVSLENGHLQGVAGVFDFSVYSDDEGIQDDVMNAYALLLEADEVKYYIDEGMILQYADQTQIIDGRTCLIFALGTDNEDEFVRELYYGVCDNLIYAYDAVSDTWSTLGAG